MNNDKYYDLIKRGECPNCGGELKELGENIFQCRFCQSKHTRISITLSDKVQQAFEKGNDELALAHFENAYRQFEKVKELAHDDPDVYWNLALAKNQIQYLKDYRNNENDKNKYRLQPICFDVLSKPFTQDENYQKALELAKDPEQKKSYQERAKEIDYIQKKFREYEKNPEYNFDSFICVKVTKDEQKNTTEDAHAADKVYNFLKSKQRNPFYSEVICNNLAGADYEAMILYALYKAKAMILICFDEAYLETPWVKNEHTRYRRMIQDGLKDPDSLLILYKGTPIERLSIDDHKREGINLANPSAYSSLLDRVDMLCTIAVPTLERKKYGKTKVTKKSVQSTNIQKRTLATIKKQEVTVSDQANLKIMQQMMDSKKYSHALAYGLGLIQDNPSFSDAYVLMFLAQQGVQTLDDFIKSKKPVESFEYFEKALATKENLSDRLPLIQALANHANTTVDLKSYQEFISLPDCNDELISGLNNLLFPKLLKSNNVLFFQEMAKTISDQDFYINANLSFAHKNSGKASMVFYQNILDIDPSDPEAL
ncbi:MAG: hypothetical protein PUE07_00685, partial [bacterium]|nr:hypothetical protein [bacterium]